MKKKKKKMGFQNFPIGNPLALTYLLLATYIAELIGFFFFFFLVFLYYIKLYIVLYILLLLYTHDWAKKHSYIYV